MLGFPKTKIRSFLRKSTSLFLVVTFGFSLGVIPAGAQLPPVGQMVWLTPGFQPPVLRGMTVHPENPLAFDFIVDRGQDQINDAALENESTKLIKYFLASMTIPDKDAWVNLSPYEKDRIIPEALGQTEMGRQMLEQDYMLKQLSASLTNPDKDLGEKYWNEVKSRAKKQFNTTEIPLNTFNKVWIMPDTATVVEKDGFAYISESKLKVMLDADLPNQNGRSESRASSRDEDVSKLSTEVFREMILPQLIREVNEGKMFAPTRQVYQSVILASWYKKALKDSLLGQIYADKSKIEGIETDDKNIKQKVYDQYLEAFKKGAYNVIKEEDNGVKDEVIPRKYFSGGLNWDVDVNVERGSSAVNRAASEINTAGTRLALVAASAAEPEQLFNRDASSALNTPETIRRNFGFGLFDNVIRQAEELYPILKNNPLADIDTESWKDISGYYYSAKVSVLIREGDFFENNLRLLEDRRAKYLQAKELLDKNKSLTLPNRALLQQEVEIRLRQTEFYTLTISDVNNLSVYQPFLPNDRNLSIEKDIQSPLIPGLRLIVVKTTSPELEDETKRKDRAHLFILSQVDAEERYRFAGYALIERVSQTVAAPNIVTYIKGQSFMQKAIALYLMTNQAAEWRSTYILSPLAIAMYERLQEAWQRGVSPLKVSKINDQYIVTLDPQRELIILDDMWKSVSDPQEFPANQQVGTQSASASVVVNDDSLISRTVWTLQQVYGISYFLNQRSKQEKVRLLLIGVGKGIAAMQLALAFPNLEIVAVNKDVGLWDEEIIRKVGVPGLTLTEENFDEVRSRVHVVELDIEDTNERRAELRGFGDSEGKFDLVVWETNVTPYLRDPVGAIGNIFNERLKNDGVYAFEIPDVESSQDQLVLLSRTMESAFSEIGRTNKKAFTESGYEIPAEDAVAALFFTVERKSRDKVQIPLIQTDLIQYPAGEISDFNQPVFKSQYETLEVVASSGVVDAALEARIRKSLASLVAGVLLGGAYVPEGLTAEFEAQVRGPNVTPTEVVKVETNDTWKNIIEKYLNEPIELFGDPTEILQKSYALFQKENPTMTSLKPGTWSFHAVLEYLYALKFIQNSNFVYVDRTQNGDMAVPIYSIMQSQGKETYGVNFRGFSLGEEGIVLDIRKIAEYSKEIEKRINDQSLAGKPYYQLLGKIFSGKDAQGIFEFLYADIANHEQIHTILHDYMQEVAIDSALYEEVLIKGKNDPDFGRLAHEVPTHLGQIALSSIPKFNAARLLFAAVGGYEDVHPLHRRFGAGLAKVLEKKFNTDLSTETNIVKFLSTVSDDDLRNAARESFKSIMKRELPSVVKVTPLPRISNMAMRASSALYLPPDILDYIFTSRFQEAVANIIRQSTASGTQIEIAPLRHAVTAIMIDLITNPSEISAQSLESGKMLEGFSVPAGSRLTTELYQIMDKYPASIAKLSAFGIRASEDGRQIIILADLARLIIDEFRAIEREESAASAAVTSNNSDTKAASSPASLAPITHGVFNRQGYVNATFVPFYELISAGLDQTIIDGRIYFANSGTLRGHEITIIWNLQDADQGLLGRTYILAGNYLGRIKEALELFTPKIRGSVMIQYEGFDPVLGQHLTKHSYRSGEGSSYLFTWFKEDPDFPRITETRSSSSVKNAEYGGINFDSSKLNLQIKRDGQGVPLALPEQNLKNIDLKGLYPVIIDILPVNSQTLPILKNI